MTARDEIGQRARTLGFDHLGVAAPALSEADRAFFLDWLAQGHHGKMSYLERGTAERLDPSLLLRDARSVVVGAIRYPRPIRPRSAALDGWVSPYARGEDYHRIVGARAADLATFLRVRFDARAAEYVDTGAVLERLWAAKAGIGWIGKNALVLNRASGSYFFLAVVLTDLEIAPDEPALDQCGACALCVEACPTGAIVADRVVDSRRCLSYHTIELRGAFPAEHREAAASRVFGCDDCQSACPWNRGDDPGEILPELRPRPGLAAPDLVELLSMPLSGYTERFRGSSLKRATYQGLRRNAAIALGNVLAGGAALDGRPAVSDADRARAIEALEAAAADDEASVAEAAAWALRAVRG